MFLTKEQILSADDRKTDIVDVPEWGGLVKIRAMTGAERDRFEQDSIEGRGKDTKMNLRNIRARLVSLSIVDENNNRLFTRNDIEALGQKSAAALDRVFGAAQKLSGLADSDVEALTDDFGSDLNGSSTSD